jgi:4'-phosphopantetheinyl transferase
MWQLSNQLPELAPGGIHVWRASFASITVDEVRQTALFSPLLSPEEVSRAARLATPALRRRYRLAHSLLHTLLREYTQSWPHRYEIVYQQAGKPILVVPDAQPPVEFNMSHTGEVVVVALARVAVGVDIEVVRPLDELDALIAATCTAQEQALFAALDPSARLRAFYRLWTRKEAWIKLLGVGMAHDVATVDVRSDPAGSTLFDIAGLDEYPEGYVGTVAVGAGEELATIELFDARWQG